MKKTSKNLLVSLVIVCFLVLGCGLMSKKEVRPEMWSKPDVLCNFSATEKLISDAKVTGKIALVSKDSTYYYPNRCNIDGYFNDPSKGIVEVTTYFPEEMYATKPEEIDTLIKIENKKGNLLNSFVSEGGYELSGHIVRVYSRFIDISIIDYKTSTVIAKQQIEFKEFPKGSSSSSVDKGQTHKVKEQDGTEVLEYIVPEAIAAYNEIKKALAKYSDKVKPAK